MKLVLDKDGRFVAESRVLGWHLTVDGKRIHYCADLGQALTYMVEELGEESPADGVEEVIVELRKVKEIMSLATAVVVEHRAMMAVAGACTRASKFSSASDRVREVSLELSGCRTVTELKSTRECASVVSRAKELVRTMSDCPCLCTGTEIG